MKTYLLCVLDSCSWVLFLLEIPLVSFETGRDFIAVNEDEWVMRLNSNYVIIMYKINHGYFHIYFLLLVIAGFVSGYFINKKTLNCNWGTVGYFM